jgi:hypothetical protein
MKNFRPAADGDYEVGYGRPPKETRFTPGKSGNPKGRPKRKRSLAADLRKEVERMVEVVENGKERRVSIQAAVMRRLVNDAIGRGNMAAMRALLGLLILVDPTVETENAQREREDAKATVAQTQSDGREDEGYQTNTRTRCVGRVVICRLYS